MNIRQGMFRAWAVISGVWLVGCGIVWYQEFSAERAQIDALNECGKIYPPVPDRYVLVKPGDLAPSAAASPITRRALEDAHDYFESWEAIQAELHPHCVPNVGAVSFAHFISTWAYEREAMQVAVDGAIRTSTITAVAYGIAVPPGLLVMGLVLAWVVRGFRAS